MAKKGQLKQTNITKAYKNSYSFLYIEEKTMSSTNVFGKTGYPHVKD
jgi:hypothetical protein